MFTMDQRKLGASELVVPALGTGVASWGDKQAGYGTSHTREDILQSYRLCLDTGLTFFDTAEPYPASECLLGECLKIDRRPILIASKFAPPLTRFSRKRSLLDALDQSLARLGIKQIDLYQIHWPSPRLKVDELMDVLAEAVHAGKIRAVGVSNYSAPSLRQAHARLAQHGIALASNQVRYNLLHRYPETNGVLDACRELQVALIAYSPLEKGILTGKYRSQETSAPRQLNIFHRLDPFGDTRGSTPAVKRLLSPPRVLQRERLEPLFVMLEEIARTREKTIAQVALNWLLMKDECVIPIPGAKNARQARENAGALGWRLTEEEHGRISRAEIASR